MVKIVFGIIIALFLVLAIFTIMIIIENSGKKTYGLPKLEFYDDVPPRGKR